MKSNLIHNLIDRIRWNLKIGMNLREAVDDVADRFGISKDGKVYAYLLKRAEEEKI